ELGVHPAIEPWKGGRRRTATVHLLLYCIGTSRTGNRARAGGLGRGLSLECDAALHMNVTNSSSRLRVSRGTRASAAGYPVTITITGFSFSGRCSTRLRNDIGLGVWVSVASPAQCRAASRN